MPTIPLFTLLSAARAILAQVGAIPRLSTLDGRHWQCLALDVDTLEHADSLPTGVASSPEGAVSTMLDALHEAGMELDGAATALRTLRDAYPEGVTVAPELTTELLLEGAFAELDDAEVA